MTNKEIYQFVKENAALISMEIKSRHKGFQLYLTESGKLATKHVDGWETGAYIFGGYHQLIYRKPSLRNKITPALVIKQSYYDLFESQTSFMSPIESVLEEAYYHEV